MKLGTVNTEDKKLVFIITTRSITTAAGRLQPVYSVIVNYQYSTRNHYTDYRISTGYPEPTLPSVVSWVCLKYGTMVADGFPNPDYNTSTRTPTVYP